jgi:membrane protein
MARQAHLGKTIRLTFAAFRRDNASRFGAALAFYIVFSITPALLMAIGVAGVMFGNVRAERAILGWIAGSFGAAAGAAIASMVRAAALWQVGWVATTLGLWSLYFGLYGVYRQVEGALQTIWGQRDIDPESRVPLKKRLASVLLVCAAGTVVLLAVVADGAVAVLAHEGAMRLIGARWMWRAAQLVGSASIVTVLFAVMFRYLAQRPVTWRDVSVGAFVTAVLFVIGKFAVGIYLTTAAVGSPFGAAGSIVVVLLWSYWSAQIFFLGLEFTHVYAQQRHAT